MYISYVLTCKLFCVYRCVLCAFVFYTLCTVLPGLMANWYGCTVYIVGLWAPFVINVKPGTQGNIAGDS